MLLYEVLSGDRPFRLEGTSAVGIEKIICETEPPRLKGLDGDLDKIVSMAMRKEPARRYASADQFSEDIRRYLEGFPVLAREDTWRYRTGKFVRRHRWGVAAAAMFLLTLLAFGTGMAILATRVAAERDAATLEREKAEQVSRFLVDSFRLADRSGQHGRTLTAQQVLDSGSEQIFRQLRDQPAVQARIMNTIGEVYESLGLYDHASSLLATGLETRRRVRGIPRQDIVESLTSMGELLATRGDEKNAERYLREALQLSGGTAEAKARLGSVLASKGTADEARALLLASLAERESSFGRGSVQVADSLERLGKVEAAQERFAAAEPYYREALAIRRRTSGRDSPVTATSISELAALLSTRGNLVESEKLQREALALHRKLYGDTHLYVAEDLASLGVLRFNSGDYGEAAELDREAIQLFRSALGPQSPPLADATVELGNSLERLGQLPQAESLMREAVAMEIRLFGENHPSVANARHNLVNALHDAGKNEEAESIMTGLVKWQRDTDAASPALGFNLAALGGLKRSRGDYTAADRDYTEALEIFRKAFGEHSAVFARSLTSLATNRIFMGGAREAEPKLRQAIAILRSIDKASSLDLSFPLVGLAQDLLRLGRPVEAEHAAREAYDLRRRLVSSPLDARVALAESVLGGSLAALHQDSEAEPLLIESHRNLLRLRNDKSVAAELERLRAFNARAAF